MSIPARLIYCHCAFAQVVPPETKSAVLEQLAAADVSFEAVPDLCEMAARRDPALTEIATGDDVAIVACYPRAVRWLFNGAGVTLPEHIRVINMREQTAEDIIANLGIPGAVKA